MHTAQSTSPNPTARPTSISPSPVPSSRKTRTPINQNKKTSSRPNPSAVSFPLSAFRHSTSPGSPTRKKPTSVSQNQKAAARLERFRLFIEANPRIFARQGTVVATWRTYKGKRLGPYYQLTYRDQDRQHWLYLGRSEQLAHQVRKLLNDLHRPRDQHRLNRRLQVQARTSLRLAKVQLKQVCARHKITLKGWEFRGVRKAFPRYIPSPGPIRPAPT